MAGLMGNILLFGYCSVRETRSETDQLKISYSKSQRKDTPIERYPYGDTPQNSIQKLKNLQNEIANEPSL